LVSASALFIHSTTAAAQEQDDPDYARAGPYLGISVEGAAYTDLSNSLEDELRSLGYIVNIETDLPVGFNVYGGYRAHPNVAVEAEFEMMPASDIKVMGIKFAEIQTWAFTGNVKVLPMTGEFQPFALVGIGVLNAEAKNIFGTGIEASNSDFAARFGGGADYYFTENIALSARVPYVLATGSIEEFDYMSFGGGLQYRF
jgi:opacity protein-like surface antigen